MCFGFRQKNRMGSRRITLIRTWSFILTRLDSLLVCAMTSNLKRAKEPGNLLLEEGEANLPRQSVVVVSQTTTVDETQLGPFIGRLAEPRVSQVLAGMRFLQSMIQHHEEGYEQRNSG